MDSSDFYDFVATGGIFGSYESSKTFFIKFSKVLMKANILHEILMDNESDEETFKIVNIAIK